MLMDSDPIDSISEELDRFPRVSPEDFEKELANLEYMILAARETFASSGLALRKDPETIEAYLKAREKYVQTPDVMRNTLHDMEKYLHLGGEEGAYTKAVQTVFSYAKSIVMHQPPYPADALQQIAPLGDKRDRAEKTAANVYPQHDDQLDVNINNPDIVWMRAQEAAYAAEDTLAEAVEEAHKALCLRRKLRQLLEETYALPRP